MAVKQVEAKPAAGRSILDQVPISVSTFQNTLSHLLELFRQFELMPPLSADRLQDLLTLPPHAWLDETSMEAICQDQDLPAGLFLFLGQKALSPFYHQAAAPFRQKFFRWDWQKGNVPSAARNPLLPASLPTPVKDFYIAASVASNGRFLVRPASFAATRNRIFPIFLLKMTPPGGPTSAKPVNGILKLLSLVD